MPNRPGAGSPAPDLRHRLRPEDLALTLQATVVAAVVEVGLRSTRLPTLAGLLGVPLTTAPGPSRRPGGPEPLPRWARRRLAASRRALRHLPFQTCLRSALVGGFMIRRLDPRLRIGVAKDNGTIRAHAWLVVDGVSLDPTSRDFATVQAIRA
jgi:hypothetical protein